MRVRDDIADLIDATSGNAIELIVVILAIAKCDLQITQLLLGGSILCNSLLVPGLGYFARGNTYISDQSTAATREAGKDSLSLIISVGAILLPVSFVVMRSKMTESIGANPTWDGTADISRLGHGISAGFLLFYIVNFVSQLRRCYYAKREDNNSCSITFSTPLPAAVVLHPRATTGGFGANGQAKEDIETHHEECEEGDVDDLSISVAMCITLLVGITVIMVIAADFLLDSINGVTDKYPSFEKIWVVMFFLPAVSKVTEVSFAIKAVDEEELRHRCRIGTASSLQITVFIIPLIDVMAWIFNKPFLTLFDPYLSVALFVGVSCGSVRVLGLRTSSIGWASVGLYIVTVFNYSIPPWRGGVFECFRCV